MYYWDGRQWLSTLSHDGRTRWNGSAWVPAENIPGEPTYQPPPRSARQPTSWTQPLQYAVAGWFALQAVYSLSLPLWMSGPMAQAVDQSFRRQQQLNPSVGPPPTDVTGMFMSMITVILWIGP
jgi:hypothetical protein